MLARLGLSRSQLLLGLFLAAIVVALAFLQSQPDQVEAYDPDDTGSLGLRALVLWLEELGHPVTINRHGSGLGRNVGLFWIHPSSTGNSDYYSEVDTIMTYSWVRRGGTLVLVGPNDTFSPLVNHFGVEQIESISGMLSDIRQVQPLLPDIATDFDSFYASKSLDFFEERSVIPLLAHQNGDPVVAIQLIGEGVVWHLTEDFALTNLNLRDERIASLLPAILRTVPEGAPVVFSTHHLPGFAANEQALGEVSTIQQWLYTTPFGQATLLVVIAVLAYLFLQGRRLGPPLPAPTASRPREAAEYVSALAGLQRRIRRPRVVADHHRHRLKHAVGRMAQLPDDLPDDAWLAQLQRAEVLSPATFNEVSRLIAGYANIKDKSEDEAALIQLVRETDALLATLPRANTQLVR